MSKTAIGSSIACAAGTVCAIGLLLTVILVPLSLHTVSYDQYGINYNKITGSVENQTVYDPGRHHLGVGHSFIKFPKVFQTIDFSMDNNEEVSARTSDGLLVEIEVSFQYRILKENVFNVFRRFATDYEPIIKYIARNSIRDVASRYNATNFFDERDIIGEEMEVGMTEALDEIFVTVEYLQFRNIDLPSEYENIIEQKEIERQRTTTASLKQDTAIVRSETDILVAQRDAQVVQTQAEATADRVRYLADATAYTTSAKYNATSDAYGNLVSALGMNPDQLLTFAWVQAVRSHEEASMVINLDKPADIEY